MASNNIVHALREIFPNKSEETILNILGTVQNEIVLSNVEQQQHEEYIFESAVNLLSATGCGTSDENTESDEHQFPLFYDYLMQMFPDCCPTYLTELLQQNHNCDIDELCDNLFTSKYISIAQYP